MPVQISPKRQVKGIYSNYNNSSGIPEGGLLEADNCVSDRPGVLSKRRGFNRYGSELAHLPGSIMDFDGSLVVHNGTNISCDTQGDGSFTSWGDFYEPPDDIHMIRGAGQKKGFYFTSSDGIYKNDLLTSSPTLAGVPEGLDMESTLVGTGAGWFENNNQVGYRIVWSREDVHKTIFLGEPSFQHIVSNERYWVSFTYSEGRVIVYHNDHGWSTGDVISISGAEAPDYDGPGKEITVIDEDNYSFEFPVDLGGGEAFAGKDYDIDIKITVPPEIIAGDKYEIFRTASSGGGTIHPGTEHKKVVQKEITSEELSSRIVEYSDRTLPISLGSFLYTNSSQETIAQRNSRPPMAKDIALFRRHMFYSDLTYRHEKNIHLDDLTDISFEDSISLKIGGQVITYKFAAQERPADREFTLVKSFVSAQKNIRATAESLVRVINRDPNNSVVYAHYSSEQEESAGKVLIRSRTASGERFSITVNSSAVGESFKDEIPTSGTDFGPEDNTIPNGLAYSKLLEPDAVPGENIVYVGSKNEPIQRIIPLRTSLLILKRDGVYKLSGNTPATFVLLPLDPAVRFSFPNAATLINDAVYCLSTQGILRIGENGTTVISYPIEDKIRNIPSYAGCNRIAFAVASEENRRLIIFTQKHSGDSHATVGWVYNYLNREWTTWTKQVKCGGSLRGSRDLYLGHALDNYVLKERNGVSERNSGDYCDEDIDIDVTAVLPASAVRANHDTPTGTTSVTFTYKYREPIRAGFLFTQGGASTKIKSITSVVGTTVVAVLENVPEGGVSVAVATVSLPIDSLIKWAPVSMGSSEHPKQFTYAMITMESGTTLTNELGFYSDAVPKAEWVGAITLNTPLGWGKGAWGTSPWGNEESVAVVPLTSPVPRQHQRCRELTLMFRHRVANEEFDIESMAFRVRIYKGKLVRAPE